MHFYIPGREGQKPGRLRAGSGVVQDHREVGVRVRRGLLSRRLPSVGRGIDSVRHREDTVWDSRLAESRTTSDLRKLEAGRLGRAERSGRDRGVGRVERGERRSGRIGRNGSRLGALGRRDGRETGARNCVSMKEREKSSTATAFSPRPRETRSTTDDSNPPWAIKSFASSGWVTTSVLG